MNVMFFASIILAFCTFHAKANDTSIGIGYQHSNYSQQHGVKEIQYVEVKKKQNQGTTLFNLSEGVRDYNDGGKWRSYRGSITYWHNWNKLFSTKSGGALAKHTPVFPRKSFQQEFFFKIIPKTSLTTGYHYNNYFDESHVNTWIGGVSLYSGRYIYSWRYMNYDSTKTGHSYSHVASVRARDKNGSGNTQLWWSYGSGAYVYDWAPGAKKGIFRGLALKRLQPLHDDFNLGVSVGKQWYATPIDKYHSIQIATDLTWRF